MFKKGDLLYAKLLDGTRLSGRFICFEGDVLILSDALVLEPGMDESRNIKHELLLNWSSVAFVAKELSKEEVDRIQAL